VTGSDKIPGSARVEHYEENSGGRSRLGDAAKLAEDKDSNQKLIAGVPLIGNIF
jgi:hypothetical protein